jgi:hypothetical protein
MTLPREHDTQPVDTRTYDSGPIQVSTYTKLSKCKYFKNHERGKPSRDEENYEVKKIPDPFLNDGPVVPKIGQ